MPAYADDGRHEVSANPRFAITSSDELLAEIGWHVREHPSTPVQTHLSESTRECARVSELFPDDESYTHVYERYGLLTDRTLLAHCIHLTDAEWTLISQRRSAVVHCPSANTFLRAGLFDFGRAREAGVRLALGTDVAAGPDVAMPRVARACIEVAKMRAMTVDPNAHIPTPAEAWGLITKEGADALGWDTTGRLEVGADADALLLRVPDTWHDEHLVGRLIYNWSPELIESRVLNGTLWQSA
jgi:guanine deaminase